MTSQYLTISVADWTELNGNLYKMFSGNRSAEHARRLCEENQASLPRPRDQTENDFLASLTGLGLNSFVFLDLTDQVVEGEWRWRTDNSPVTWVNWSNNPIQPDGGTGENCAVVAPGRDDKGWLDDRCDSLHFTVCQKSEFSLGMC